LIGVLRLRRISPEALDRLKQLLFLVGLFPMVRWFWLGWQDQLTANPTEFLTRSSGTWTLVSLLVTLSISPLRQVLGQPSLIRLRRMCGLFTFFYASLHALAWAWWDQGFFIGPMIRDVIDRPFISVGMTAFVLLLLLAITSNQRAMRLLGVRWKWLHRGVYVIGALVILHYWWHKAGKNDFSEVTVYALVMVFLLGWRLVSWLKPGIKKA
jgi:sulfoxide reductase heme-binding subunit YedZ